ncbi:MAG: hypothetical protein ACOCQ7_01615 [Natronomonas sp.]
MFWKVLAFVIGSFVALFPRRSIDYLVRALLGCFENPEDLEPSPWFVSVVRLKGILLSIAAVVSLILSTVLERPEEPEDADSSSGESRLNSIIRLVR